MRDGFSGYYRPSEAEFKKLWENGHVCLDANVLLNFYKYSERTRTEFVGVLKKVQGRLWVPHQAAAEFHRNRIQTIQSQVSEYEKLISELERGVRVVEARIKAIRHPLLGEARDAEQLRKAADQVISGLKKRREAQFGFFEKDPMKVDPVLEALEPIVAKSVGAPPKDDVLQAWYNEGKKRYPAKVPPGYKDSPKPEPQRYGDLVVWMEIIQYAKQKKVPILFVTDDRKEDWWLELNERTLGPRPELVDEIAREAGVPFYAYGSDRFLEQANTYLATKVSQEAIKEAREVKASADILATWTAPATASPEQLRSEMLDFLRTIYGDRAEHISKHVDFELSPGDAFEVTRHPSGDTLLVGKTKNHTFSLTVRTKRQHPRPEHDDISMGSVSVCPVCNHLNPSAAGVFVNRCDNCGRNYSE